MKETKKELTKANKRTAEDNEKLKSVSNELEESKKIVKSEIVKNQKKQQKIEELEDMIKDNNVNYDDNQTKQDLADTKAALEGYYPISQQI